MRIESRNKKVTYFAYMLILISLILLTYGFILNLKGIELSKNNNDIGKNISVTTLDDIRGSDVSNSGNNDTISDDNIDNVNNPILSDDDIDNVNNPILGDDNHSDNSNKLKKEENKVTNSNDIITLNSQLRKEIQDTYGITVKYGDETKGYTVSNITTEPIVEPEIIRQQLIQLDNTLKLYPEGMFKEIRDGGIPLTIILVKSYSQENVTGVTDSSYSFANISIAAVYPFMESFFHESYHYIERYLFKKGADYNSWNSLNPEDFQYGIIYNNLSYSNTFMEKAPFVNNYAQTAATEDRASTFEYMMASSKASCLNSQNIVWKKARYMATTIDDVLDTVSPDVVEYWERYL